MIEFFFGVHETSLHDLPAAACIIIPVLFMLNKKWILRVIECLYVLIPAHHALVLHTIAYDMELQAVFRLGLGAVVAIGGTALAGYWIDWRSVQRQWYQRMFPEMETAGKRLSDQINNMLDCTEIVEGTLTPAREAYMITMTALQSNRQYLELIAPKTPASA